MPAPPDLLAHVGNMTGAVHYFTGHSSPHRSLWSLIQGNVNSIVSQSVSKASYHLSSATKLMGGFRRRLQEHLQERLAKVLYQPNVNNSAEIHHDVELVVDESMQDVNMTKNSTFREDLVRELDSDIEVNAFNTAFLESAGDSGHSQDNLDFFHKMPIKDETLFVVLVCMGVIIPIILITLFAIFFYKRRRNNKERRQEMLLKDQPEFSMDEYPTDSRNDEEVPDLDLKSLRT
ncbi:uncharacterized protein LOC101852281 [Aplysia californica]|uniref:Uncharacterized protein LOC101852281 n=1 Tax=Aplysia californica TaxID=6500 RepID=A0ABM0K6T3_APLCA|nr:uncharacterized protein LOC101852281 [Aplysia californica]